jgi:quercetin dioxygenase-like cupin family protein
MNSSNLPGDDRVFSPSPLDRLLQLELQKEITNLFDQSCDRATRDLLSKCQWKFKTSEPVLTLEISCSDAETYQEISQIKAQMTRSLKELFSEKSQIDIINLTNRQATLAKLVATNPIIFQYPISPPLLDQIAYLDREIHQIVLSQDQRGQFSLVCISIGDDIPAHSALRGTAIYVLEGQGRLDQAGNQISLQPGSFVYVPPKTIHTLSAIENLAILYAWV